MKFLLSICVALVLFACSSGDKKDGADLPPATGDSGDIYLVMDSAQQAGPLGKVLDSLFRSEMQGLPREEANYNMLWIDPRKLNMVLKQRRNMIFAVSLDRTGPGAQKIKSMFTPESVAKIKQDQNFFMKTSTHVFAKGQEVMYLFGRNENELLANIRKNKKRVLGHFDRIERERLKKTLYKSGQVKGVSGLLQKDFQVDMLIPFGFKLVENNNEFLWARQINSRDDRDVFVARKKYTSADEFKKENLIAFRNEICKKYLFDDPEQLNSYLITETTIPFIPVQADTVNFNKHFAMELRGLWKTNTSTMGGPFVGYALVDEGTGYFYYVEGFIYAPGKEQRELIREIETILSTFRTSDDLKNAVKK
jgi:hypothetical protein